tara:strand:- start:209 stop:913 length:705 start_codon:yes stop_codon:yes gene_type:complete
MKFRKKINIYADGVDLKDLKKINQPIINGFTFNPSLFRSNNVTNYINHSKKILKIIKNKPVSLEIIADDEKNMIRQAYKLSNLANNVFVKIPISNTKGVSSRNVIKELSSNNIKLNVTAIFTLDQVKQVLDVMDSPKNILSIFSGRIFDIGIDAVKHTRKINKYIKKHSKCKSLWASPRMVFDVINAIDAESNIITMSPQLISKLSLFNKSADDFSLDTVKMFYNDAMKSKYKF